MPLILKDVEYLQVREVAAAAGVRRETFWRWRKDRKVPQGRQYRNTRIFTAEETAEICAYATTARPLEDTQIALFRGRS
jgi:predicted DNA-binding transcriptional regulator AlpA